MAERRKIRRPPSARSRIVGVLLVLGLGVVVWAVVGEFDRLTDKPPTPAANAPSPAPTSLPAAVPSVPASVRACVDAVQRGGAAVDRARATMADWVAHVQAMADLQSGRNTEAETKRVWAETRARGPQGVAGFHSAYSEYRRLAGGCDRLPEAELPADVASAVAVCRDVRRQTDAVLAAAQGAVADWSAHLKAMADRRAGRLDAHAAHVKWLAAYRAAPVNIEKFRAAERVYGAHPPCALPG
jgi:hypothetical protein